MSKLDRVFYSFCCVFWMGYVWGSIFQDWFGWPDSIGKGLGATLGLLTSYFDLWRNKA